VLRAVSGTIAEIVEHLANVQEGMGKVTSKLLNEAKVQEPAQALMERLGRFQRCLSQSA
jgi:hypothetical protein